MKSATGNRKSAIDMILVLDNYDSFTYNLVQYLGELGADLQVKRNDEISLEQIRALKPERILVSPGPCSPRESGLSNEVIRTFAGEGIPIFGVCLGHQCIGHTFGAEVVVNYRMMHGKTSPIKHNGKDLFVGMPNPFPPTSWKNAACGNMKKFSAATWPTATAGKLTSSRANAVPAKSS